MMRSLTRQACLKVLGWLAVVCYGGWNISRSGIAISLDGYHILEAARNGRAAVSDLRYGTTVAEGSASPPLLPTWVATSFTCCKFGNSSRRHIMKLRERMSPVPLSSTLQTSNKDTFSPLPNAPDSFRVDGFFEPCKGQRGQ